MIKDYKTFFEGLTEFKTEDDIPDDIKELIEMENQFVVISSALNDLNTRLNQLSSVVVTNQTLQPITYSADDIQAMNLDDEDEKM